MKLAEFVAYCKHCGGGIIGQIDWECCEECAKGRDTGGCAPSESLCFLANCVRVDLDGEYVRCLAFEEVGSEEQSCPNGS